MAESPDLDTLARRYLDLWQDQVAAMAADPELSETMMRLWQNAAAAGPAGWAQLWAAVAPRQAATGTPSDFTTATATTGSAPAAAPSGDRGDDVAELGRRVAELELRLGRIEAAIAVGPRGGGGGTRTRRRVQRPPAEDG